MGNLFNPDNTFFRIMGKAWDMLVVSLMWTICCIPMYFLITIVGSELNQPLMVILYMALGAVLMIPVGPAMSSIYYVCVKVIRRDRGYVFHEYLHAFRINFRTGAITGAIVGAILVLLSFNLQYSYALSKVEGGMDTMGKVVLVVTLAICFVLTGILLVIFPILSRFTMGVKQLFKTSLYIAFRHILHTLLLLVIVLVSAAAMYLLLPAVFFIPAACALVSSFPMEHVLKKYMPKPEKTAAADGVLVTEGDVVSEENGERRDLWYLE
ncbi:MAG: DUF624 domain-containing protein [Lachnospiraceae bacterium]|nr:DUF624 domain-containing protein [Lachnospiraceae bacterium]